MDDGGGFICDKPFKFVLDNKFEKYHIVYDPTKVTFITSIYVEIRNIWCLQFPILLDKHAVLLIL